jgi:hypothetical protein
MADSDITVNGLATSGGISTISLIWNPPNDPHQNGGHPYLQLNAVEIYAASSNNRGSASKIGEQSIGTGFVHSGLSRAAQRWYWIRPRNNSLKYGDWHPLSATAGVSGQEANNTALLSANGYFLNKNGLLQQWGTLTTNGFSGVGSASWPVAFSTLFNFIPTVVGFSPTQPLVVNIVSANASSFSVFTAWTVAGVFQPVAATVNWSAIGAA